MHANCEACGSPTAVRKQLQFKSALKFNPLSPGQRFLPRARPRNARPSSRESGNPSGRASSIQRPVPPSAIRFRERAFVRGWIECSKHAPCARNPYGPIVPDCSFCHDVRLQKVLCHRAIRDDPRTRRRPQVAAPESDKREHPRTSGIPSLQEALLPQFHGGSPTGAFREGCSVDTKRQGVTIVAIPEHPFRFGMDAFHHAQNRLPHNLPHLGLERVNVAKNPRYDFVPVHELAPVSCNSSAGSLGLTDRAGCRT